MRRVSFALIAAILFSAAASAAERVEPAAAAKSIDQQLAAEVKTSASKMADRSDDATFLRRASLDIIGRNPTVSDVLAFRASTEPNKRAKAIERLLADARYGENWAHYWRDVIMYRRSEERGLIASQSLTTYLTDELNKNTPWNTLASSFVTASGDVTENGATAIMMAQQGRPEETVAEVARIFMGIQIACAQCHDHPTDRWKREQFHELAAFFPRVAVRQMPAPTAGMRRSFEVYAQDDFPRRGRGRISANRNRGTAEHYMPDLDNPTARGKLMTPAFFATDQKLSLGVKDEDRRTTLANWLTGPENEWFSKAIVNRLWSELVGEGFYEPVDDMGPDRQSRAPKTLDLLAKNFVASGHDVKWLFTTIMMTDAYQRASQSRRKADDPPFAANVPQRLRSDQILANLTSSLELGALRGRGRGRGMAPMPAPGPRGQRGNPLVAAFGYDPSEPRDEIAGSIPQALALMNAPQINQATTARGRINSPLARVMNQTYDNKELVQTLYLRTLARQPTDAELKTCLSYIQDVGNRVEAIEDLQWALVNSTEFLHRK